jgi:two-component system chemotaxis response regulator CheB
VQRTPIRVLLVDDSPLVLVVLKRALATSPEIEVVGTARDGREALELIPMLRPAVICTDFHMPVMNGLELTREVMAKYPCPILVVSTAVGPGNNETVFSLLEAGAIDVFPKPRGLEAGNLAVEELVSKIKIISGVIVFPRRPKESFAPLPPPVPRSAESAAAPVRIVAIGASTGGPQALQAILTRLPPHFPAPILCVQHISDGFLEGLVNWLGMQCKVKFKVARSGEIAQAGTVYFPEEGTHLIIDDRGRLVSSHGPPLGGHRPSVTVTFKSVAEHYGHKAAAVLLTGMGKDGGEGMLHVSRAGGLTIAQNQESCVVFGMPKEAIDLGAARHVLSPDEIAARLLEAARGAPASA